MFTRRQFLKASLGTVGASALALHSCTSGTLIKPKLGCKSNGLMPGGMQNIEHVVVVMLENRSFDNLLGWLYSDRQNHPPYNIPTLPTPAYEGLIERTFFNEDVQTNTVVYASEPTSSWPPDNNPMLVPDPDPGESFEQVTRQIFGTAKPLPNAQADMSGFLMDYTALTEPTAAAQIMQSYSPQQVPVVSGLAKSFAVCDHWYTSAPCETWPNRGFVHTGSSDGHINNDDYEPYDIQTIFNVMSAQGISWGVYTDTIYTPSLTYVQFPRLWFSLEHFKSFSTFKRLCDAAINAPASDRLPEYSFVEPRFTIERGEFENQYPTDYHPPYNVSTGEQFLAEVYNAVRQSPYRDKILMIITFDEHGGCYDHVPPPMGAVAPYPGPVSRDGTFHFDRYGVRVPTIVVSSYVRPGTVFRAAPGATPYDHTSILATLRDWKNMACNERGPFLPSPRIKNAPTLQSVLALSESNKRTNWPAISLPPGIGGPATEGIMEKPINSLQLSLLVGVANQRNNNQYIGRTAVHSMRQQIRTHRHALAFMRPDLKLEK
ncbi:MAG TPA: alkaline phosphatase family protein [Nitrospira sp.]|nr:alkaline phosphatase family protein [Nitrospira sp.]